MSPPFLAWVTRWLLVSLSGEKMQAEGQSQLGGEDNGFSLGTADSRVFVESIGSPTGLDFRLELPFGELST